MLSISIELKAYISKVLEKQKAKLKHKQDTITPQYCTNLAAKSGHDKREVAKGKIIK